MIVDRQFSILLDNKPGRLHRICSTLAKEKVSIQALTVTDGRESSEMRFVVDNPQATREALQQINVPFNEAEVVLVELKHQPGALANLCERLAAEHVNIDSVYCSAGARNGKAIAIVKATPLNKVRDALTEKAPPKKRTPKRRPPAGRA